MVQLDQCMVCVLLEPLRLLVVRRGEVVVRQGEDGVKVSSGRVTVRRKYPKSLARPLAVPPQRVPAMITRTRPPLANSTGGSSPLRRLPRILALPLRESPQVGEAFDHSAMHLLEVRLMQERQPAEHPDVADARGHVLSWQSFDRVLVDPTRQIDRRVVGLRMPEQVLEIGRTDGQPNEVRRPQRGESRRLADIRLDAQEPHPRRPRDVPQLPGNAGRDVVGDRVPVLPRPMTRRSATRIQTTRDDPRNISTSANGSKKMTTKPMTKRASLSSQR